jgi:predicted Zn-dependent protease
VTSSRIDIFKQILESDPENSAVLFGLAKEYEKSGDLDQMIVILRRYVEKADDEGNAYGMLARAYGQKGEHALAKEAYERGISAAVAHGHPGMAEDFRMMLASEYED